MNTDALRLVVNHSDPEEVRVALCKGTELQGVRCWQSEAISIVGAVYWGRVLQVEAGLEAAFVDIGEKRAAFLHFGNIHPAYAEEGCHPMKVAERPSQIAEEAAGAPEEPIDKMSSADGEGEQEENLQEKEVLSPADFLKPGDAVLVQVLRDPVRGKGATLTTFLSLPGRYGVLMPSLNRVGVSRKIVDMKERSRLRAIFEGMSAAAAGMIARTAASGVEESEILKDLELLQSIWADVRKQSEGREDVGCLWQEASPFIRAVQDLCYGEVTEILVDSNGAKEEAQGYIQRYFPDGGPALKVSTSSKPIFEAEGLERDWQLLFRPRVPIGSGASIVIHETEALVAIDVNSGRLDRNSLEETAFDTNCLAAVEAARQIRLRDIGGIVVLDFIDMRSPENRFALENLFRDELAKDPAKSKVGPLAAFGLLSMTRRRQGFGLRKGSAWMCKGCGGSGSTSHHQAGGLRVLRKMRTFSKPTSIQIRCHPGVEAVLKGAFKEVLHNLGHSVKVLADPQVPSGDSVVEVLAPDPRKR